MDTSVLQRILQPDILGVMIPIVAIITFGGLAIIRVMFRHRERMAMIEHGIHPDYPPDDVESEEREAAGDRFEHAGLH